MLRIEDLHVSVDGREIIKGISLDVVPGKIHVLMGPNGSGKTTLGYALMGHPRFKITSGKIVLNNEDITKLLPHERAKRGLFLSFQHPVEISGVTLSNFLRYAREAVTGEKLSVMDFHRLVKEKLALLKIESSFLKRYVNENFSGGEKKRCEMLQMSVLEPKIAILDEPDSGTDVDALKLIGTALDQIKKNINTGFLLITHHNKILDYLTVDNVSVIVNGKVVETGGRELAKKVELEGYSKYQDRVAI